MLLVPWIAKNLLVLLRVEHLTRAVFDFEMRPRPTKVCMVTTQRYLIDA
jgi:hypothetical protein